MKSQKEIKSCYFSTFLTERFTKCVLSPFCSIDNKWIFSLFWHVFLILITPRCLIKFSNNLTQFSRSYALIGVELLRQPIHCGNAILSFPIATTTNSTWDHCPFIVEAAFKLPVNIKILTQFTKASPNCYCIWIYVVVHSSSTNRPCASAKNSTFSWN